MPFPPIPELGGWLKSLSSRLSSACLPSYRGCSPSGRKFPFLSSGSFLFTTTLNGRESHSLLMGEEHEVGNSKEIAQDPRVRKRTQGFGR